MKTGRCRMIGTRHTSRGLSLVELMVSLALGLLIISGMLTLLARNSETRGEIEKAGRQVENGRYAIQRLSEDLHHAGFYGEFYDLPAGTSVPPDPCSTSLATIKTDMAFPVQGLTAAATPPTCIDPADFIANTNVLVVRFASPALTLAEGWVAGDLATLAAGVTYIQPYVEGVNFATTSSAPSAASLFPTAMVRGPGDVPATAPIYRYITRIYF